MKAYISVTAEVEGKKPVSNEADISKDDLELLLEGLDYIHANEGEKFYPHVAKEAGALYDRLRDELGLVFDGEGRNAPLLEVFPDA